MQGLSLAYSSMPPSLISAPQDALSATGGRLAGAAADGSLLKAAIAVGALTLLPQVFEGDGLG